MMKKRKENTEPADSDGAQKKKSKGGTKKSDSACILSPVPSSFQELASLKAESAERDVINPISNAPITNVEPLITPTVLPVIPKIEIQTTTAIRPTVPSPNTVPSSPNTVINRNCTATHDPNVLCPDYIQIFADHIRSVIESFHEQQTVIDEIIAKQNQTFASLIEEIKREVLKPTDEKMAENIYNEIFPILERIKTNFEYPGLKLSKNQKTTLLYTLPKKPGKFSSNVLNLARKKITKYFNNARDNFTKNIVNVLKRKEIRELVRLGTIDEIVDRVIEFRGEDVANNNELAFIKTIVGNRYAKLQEDLSEPITVDERSGDGNGEAGMEIEENLKNSVLN